MKEKFKKIVRKIDENHQKAVAMRNKNLLRTAVLWGMAAGLYACHYYEFASGIAYIFQGLFILMSIPAAFIGFGILFVEFWFTSKVDAALSVASGGKMVAEMALGEAKDRLVEKAVESSREKPKAAA